MGQKAGIIERDAFLQGFDGAQVPVFVAEPQGAPGAGRLAIVPEIFGITPWVRETARRLAREGFRAVAVEQFSRDPLPDDPGWPALLARMRRLSLPGLLTDLRAALELLGGTGKQGVIGFCMGGTVAILMAGDGKPLDAAVSCYGRPRLAFEIGPLRPEEPLDAARGIRCPVLGVYGDQDASIPSEDVNALRAVLPRGSEIATYPAGHAFLNDTRPDFYSADQAPLAWAKITGFLRRTLD